MSGPVGEGLNAANLREMERRAALLQFSFGNKVPSRVGPRIHEARPIRLTRVTMDVSMAAKSSVMRRQIPRGGTRVDCSMSFHVP